MKEIFLPGDICCFKTEISCRAAVFVNLIPPPPSSGAMKDIFTNVKITSTLFMISGRCPGGYTAKALQQDRMSTPSAEHYHLVLVDGIIGWVQEESLVKL